MTPRPTTPPPTTQSTGTPTTRSTPTVASVGFRPVEAVRNYGILVITVVMVVYLGIVSPAFLSPANWANLLETWAPAGIMAVALTFVLIAGGFDLSAGAVFALGGIVAAQVTIATGSTPLGVLAGLVAGTIVGLINGLLIAFGKINAFVATLASGIVLSGINLALTKGLLVGVTQPDFAFLGQERLFGLKISVWILVIVFVIGGIVLHRTVFGLYVFAVGGNSSTAQLSGVPVAGVRVATYAGMGFAAALAGVLAASRIVSADAGAGGTTLLFTVFTVVIIGGTSLAGGAGAIWRSAVGLLVLAMIANGFVLLNITAVYQQILQGLILMGAVGLDAWVKRRR